MDIKYSTSQQYQPLRVPQSFDKYGRALVKQIEEIFDDVYRRFGRLKTTDLGKELRDLILLEDENGNYVSIATTIQGIQTDIHDQLGNYYTKSETAAKITQDLGDALGNYYTKSETATQISTTMTTALGNYYTKTETASKITQDIGDALGNYYTKSETATQISTSMSTALGNYYTKSETASEISQAMGDALGNYYTKTETASKISSDLSTALGDYSTTQQTAGLISAAVGNCYGKVSGIEIKAAGIEISGSTYVKILTGGSFQTQSNNFKIDTNGNVEIVGSLKAGSTFAGTMSANCITGGTINGNNVTITNLSASNISGGTLNANNVTISNLKADAIQSGTMSAERIKGGTLTLGGNNNTNGTLIIKNDSGTQIGKWDKDGISASAGTFSGQLSGATGTFAGQLSAATGTFAGQLSAATGTFSGSLSAATGTFAGQLSAATGTFEGQLSAATGTFNGSLEAGDGTFKVDATNKNIKASSWTIDSSGMVYNLGTNAGKFAMGQNADRSHISDLRVGFKINNDSLSIYSPTSSTWTDALQEIKLGYVHYSGNIEYSGIFPGSNASGLGGLQLGDTGHQWYDVYSRHGTFEYGVHTSFVKIGTATGSGLSSPYYDVIHTGNIGSQSVNYATSAGSAPDSTARSNASDAQNRCGTLEGKTSMIIRTFGGFSTNAKYYIPLINGGARVFAGIDKDFTAFYLRAGTLKHSGLPDGFTASLAWSDANSRYEILVERTNGNEFHCGGIAFTI